MCLTPIVIQTVDTFGLPVSQSVNCGKCIECLKDKQNNWKIRIQEESRDHLYCYFFTLTYNESSVPFVIYQGRQINHVCKSHLQLWIKRNRIAFERLFNRSIDFKYFICSEYGPNTLRPHYHGIIFTDISPVFISYMFSDWSSRFGFVNFSEVGKLGKRKTKSRISSVGNYVAKYCCKPASFKSDKEIEIESLFSSGVIPRPFYIMSKGIGFNYINRMKHYHKPCIRSPVERISVICDRAFYHDGAFKYKLPRYFRERLYMSKFPYLVQVWNKNKNCYEEKTVFRYASKGMLSRQMQIEVRNRLSAEYDKRFAELRLQYPYWSETQIHIELVRLDAVSRLVRFKNIHSKMSRFYNFNRFKQLKF